MTHPDELLAEYVEGALDPSARQTLRALPQVEEPPGLTMAVLREARDTTTAPRWATPLRVAAAVVLLAGVAAAGIYVFSQLEGGGGDGDAAGSADQEAPDAGAPAAEADEGAGEERSSAQMRAPYPEVRHTGADHDADSVVNLASRLKDEAREALDAGFPRNAFAFYDAYPVASFPPEARDALVCAGQGLEPDRSVVPFVIDEAAWEGAPAWVVSYLQGPDPSARYDRLQILVVGREACAVLHFAQQRL